MQLPKFKPELIEHYTDKDLNRTYEEMTVALSAIKEISLKIEDERYRRYYVTNVLHDKPSWPILLDQNQNK